ncbi:MAG: hypothetical protein OEY51_08260 [Cyclobacteriaceae bacterium]|nr:hypothetical protein [Cyclobacteriaceae bacterium]
MILLLLLMVLLGACIDCICQNGNSPYLDSLYQVAVKDAQIIEAIEVDTLTIVSRDNDMLEFRTINKKEYVKAVTWIDDEVENLYKEALQEHSSELVPKSGIELWLSLYPELQNFCAGVEVTTEEDLILRMKQKLGLPHTGQNSLIAEIWVPVESIKRPCLNTDVKDTLCFVEMSVNVERSEYHEWYFAQRADVRKKGTFPFTGLGYTYDWAPGASEFGLSEFVLIGNGKEAIYIENLSKPKDYCR